MYIRTWNNCKVLITGSSGFVGGALASTLLKTGARVLGISRHPNDTSWEKALDTVDKKSLHAVFRSFAPDVCFHLASDALVEFGAEHPYEVFDNNIRSALNILEAARMYSIPRTVIASTSHVYGKTKLPYREDDPARPSRPYETSKTCVDLIAQSYADSFNLPVLIPRFVNIYGPGDRNMSRLIPKTMKRVVSGQHPTMWGGRSKRQYVYIDDVLSAYDTLARMTDAQIEKNRIYNIGGGDAVSVKELIEKIIAISGKQLHIERIEEGREEELAEQTVLVEKIKRTLGWKAKTTLEDGLRKTYDWFVKGYSTTSAQRKGNG